MNVAHPSHLDAAESSNRILRARCAAEGAKIVLSLERNRSTAHCRHVELRLQQASAPAAATACTSIAIDHVVRVRLGPAPGHCMRFKWRIAHT
jgi:hypothetical protein